jgi:hypothetical protein
VKKKKMRDKKIMKKAVTLLLVLLMIGSLCGVTAVADETADLTDPPEGKVPSVEVTEVEQAVPVFREGEDEPLPRPNHPPIDQIPPMPMPQDTDELPASEGPGLGTLYNAVTGETIVSPVDETALLGGFQQGGSYSGADGGGGIEELPMTFNNMYKITNTGASPWRMNAKLVMRFEDAGGNDHWYVCSGTMRDAETALTAGHCVYDRSHGYGWAKEIWVYPGWDGDEESDNAENYGRGHGTYFGSWTGWTQNGDWNYDVGIIGVTRAVGMLTGWYGWAYGGSCDWHKSQTYNNPSYPAEPCGEPGLHNGRDMYYWYGHFDSCPSWNRLQIDTSGGCYNAGWGGMSGSGAYYIDGGNRYVHAFASTSDRSTYARYSRQWESWVNWNNNVFIPNVRGSAFDLQALDVNAEPETIKQGGSTTLLNHLAANPTDGSASGTWTVRVYLSTNDYISSGDTLLSTQYYTWNFNPMSSVRVNMAMVTIPYNTPQGDYWIGVIYDPATDGNSANNDASGWDAVPIHVIKETTPPPAPVISSSTHPNENVWYSNNDPTFTWTTPSDPSGIACYSYTIDHSSSTTPDTTCDTTGNSKSYTNLGDGIWYFHVRAKDNAGNWGPADHYRVKIDTTLPSAAISINSGATYTTTTSVTLSLTNSDSGSGVDKCRYKNSGGSWTGWQTCTATKAWALTTGDGTKRVYYEVKDKAGNVKQVSDTIILDTTDPSASISINSGATCTNTRSVTLSLTYSDGLSGVDKCRYKNSGGSWTSWQTCTPTKTWTLTTGDGTKTVYYQVRDRAGNIRQVYDSIRLDTTPPPAPVISSSTHPNENNWYCNRNPTFTWTTPYDLCGIACYSYTLDHSPTTTPDKICDTTGNSKSYSGLAHGTWYFHVRAKDNAGNWGSADHYRVMIENCDDRDGCYTYGNGCEDRDYYCDGSVCKYTVSNRHTDYYDDWVYYCSGDTVRKHRLFHDFYCGGEACTDHTSWEDDQLVEDCNDHDDWYDTGDTRWIDDPANECKEKEQKKQEYRDYTCSGGACTYSVTNTQWIDTGNVRNKPDGTVCGCTANNTLKECYGGTCTDTGICNSTYCAADAACDGKNPGDDCNGDRKCNATCKCVLTENSDLEITGTWICWPDNCTICYNVTNTGNGTASAGHNTMLYVDGLEVEHDPVPVALASGDGYIGCFNYVWTYTPPNDNITVCADFNNTVDESNETNNCLNETWKCGDVDMDRDVDFLGDVRGVARYYMNGEPIKCPWAGDVDCDGDIDFLGDARGISRHYMYGEALDCCCN